MNSDLWPESGEHPRGVRQGVILGVDILLPGQPTRRGSLCDLGTQGACLGRTGLPVGLRRGTRLQLGLRIPPDNPEGYFRVAALITRLDPQGTEVRFLDPPAALELALDHYLQALGAERTRAEAQERRRAARRERINAASRSGAGAQAVALLRGLLEAVAAGLAEQGERAGNDLERVRARDDAGRLRHACRRNGLPLRLAGDLLKLGPDTPAGSQSVSTLLDDERTRLWLATRELTERLESRLALPLRQLTYRLQELQAGNARPPCTPAALAQALEQALADLDISLAGRLYSLRSADTLTQPLAALYRSLLASWERLEGQPP